MGYGIIKYLLFLFNLLCTICGVLLVVFGSIIFYKGNNFEDITEAIKTQQVPITMIVLGTIIVLISFFGCCGAIRESYCMSMTYSLLLFVLMIGQLALVIYMWLEKDKYLQLMADVVEKAWAQRTRKANYMDALQISMHCCGKNSPADYSFQGVYPASCCPDSQPCRIENIYRVGCKTAFVDFWDTNSYIIKITGLIIAAIEFVGFIFACCLANNIRNYRRRSEY